MKSKQIFTLTHSAGSERAFRTRSGEPGTQLCGCDVGYIQGSASAMKAIVLEGSTDSELWQLLNFVDQQNVYLATIAVLGATSPEHAIDSALRTFNQDFNGIAMCTPYDVIDAPAFVLERFLNNESRARFKSRVTEKELLKLHQKITMNPVVWTGDTSLSSHSDVGALVSDMVRYDPMRLMQESVTPAMVTSIITDGAETAQFDSIVSQVTRLDGLSSRILTALGKVADKVKPLNVTKTDPFKKHGVVNIAQIYEMADGQTITIVYHNPDSTPSRLDPKDLVTSWKFLLNKRDVTAALQPKSGKDVNVSQLATRMMKIVEANSARFIRGQERKAKAEKALVELGSIEVEKQQQISTIDTEIELLQAELDQDIASAINVPINVSTPIEPQVDNSVAKVIDAVDDPDSPDYLKANEALYKELKEDLQNLVPDQENEAYQAKRDKMEHVTAVLKQNGISIDESTPAEPETVQTAEEPETVADNPDELWLDQIIAGEVDLAGLSMTDFAGVAEKYATDTATPIYAKLEQALNAITVAKMDKAKAVQG